MVRHPKDRNLPKLLTRLNNELETCYKKEVANEVTNPIKVAVDLMALNEDDMELWLQAFERIDKDRRGKILIEEVFEYIDLVLTDIGREIFNTVDAFDHNQMIEFGDFLRAVGTFCFFGKDEVIRYELLCFSHYLVIISINNKGFYTSIVILNGKDLSNMRILKNLFICYIPTRKFGKTTPPTISSVLILSFLSLPFPSHF